MVSLLAPFHLIFIQPCERQSLLCPLNFTCMYSGLSTFELFLPIHPLNVFLVVCLELLALEFECVCDQACLRCPGIGTQMDLPGDLKALKFR